MEVESVYTPWLQQAIKIYSKTLGRIPPILYDIRITETEQVFFKILPKFQKGWLTKWSFFILLLYRFVFVGCSLALLKLLFASNIKDTNILEIVLLFLYWYYTIIFQHYLHILEENRDLLTQIDLFLKHGLLLGNNIIQTYQSKLYVSK